MGWGPLEASAWLLGSISCMSVICTVTRFLGAAHRVSPGKWGTGAGRGGESLISSPDSWLELEALPSDVKLSPGWGWLPQVGILVVQASLVTLTLAVLPSEPGQPEEKAEEAVHRAQVARACYLVSGSEEPGTGWRLVALQLGPRRLLLLLSAQSPTYGLRGLATHTLHALTPLL